MNELKSCNHCIAVQYNYDDGYTFVYRNTDKSLIGKYVDNFIYCPKCGLKLIDIEQSHYIKESSHAE